jgi:RNA polymerase sigma-70 factor (ECF subfamily)|tara:strand:+ start:1421 stop:1921 length:501 start_codon:yes stop_codon:yes gene_type:complete
LAAQSEIYKLYADVLFGISLKYSRNYQDAEDTLQDSFLIIFDKIKQYNNKGSFEGWLKRIVINTALQKYRKKNHLQLIKEVSDTEEVVEVDFEDTHLDIGFLLKLVQELPDKYRLVFNLYVLDSYSHREISKMLNISEGTSKSNLSRARKKIKEKLEKHQQREQNA